MLDGSIPILQKAIVRDFGMGQQARALLSILVLSGIRLPKHIHERQSLLVHDKLRTLMPPCRHRFGRFSTALAVVELAGQERRASLVEGLRVAESPGVPELLPQAVEQAFREVPAV
jgi:hypothetical protein